ncbi:Maf family protein [Atopomonas sediminilitoris]|uniref:Maf family protein n=1 Tax=Atopomonas sediminilitoris TaxID=2919919 RepID=UPI001F4D6202|nr:Maf family protein [Atopomonas sediminilitoris]MCJ8167795.1 Maf family nucleotide pyrophosphatase [Atopomonas sediminilitoris]
MLPLLLASSSPYRRELLQRLQIPFTWAAPEIDETALAEEDPHRLCERLAHAKASALLSSHPQHLIIGSDQVAVLGKRILGKPHTPERACLQLSECSGQRVDFLTSLCLLDSSDGSHQLAVVPFSVQFRALKTDEIERYVAKEQPLDCAGSFKVEGLGISLFEHTQGTDQSSLIGLPLIKLCTMLRNKGWQLP